MLVIPVLEKLRLAWVSDPCLKISSCSLLALEISRTSEYYVSTFHEVLSVCSLFLMSSWWTQGQLCHMSRWIRGLSRLISSSGRAWVNVISSVEFSTPISLPLALHLLCRQIYSLDRCPLPAQDLQLAVSEVLRSYRAQGHGSSSSFLFPLCPVFYLLNLACLVFVWSSVYTGFPLKDPPVSPTNLGRRMPTTSSKGLYSVCGRNTNTT